MVNGFNRSAISGWTVSFGVPKTIMMAEIWHRLWWTIAGTALLSLTGVVLALLMARRIAGSIQGLIAPALALGRGEAVAVGYLEFAETNAVGESLVKASQVIQQRAAERERAETARRESEELKRFNAELEQSEAEARARATELAAILDAVPAITFIAHDPACRRMTSNRAGYDMLRLPPGANTSKSAPESERSSNYAFQRDGRVLSPDELPVQLAAATGRAVRDCEYTIAFDDGTTWEVFGNAVPLLDDTGRVRGAVGAFIDITERKRAQLELEQLARIVESADDAIISVSLTGAILSWNQGAGRLLGYTKDEMIGVSEEKLLPAEKSQEWEQVREVMAGGKALDYFKTVRIAKSGEEKPVWLRISPIRDGSGRIIGISKIARDRSQAIKAQALEEKLRQAQKLESLGRLAGGVAHDFNNLLMVIQSYAEMLQDKLADDNPLRRNTQEIIKAANRAASLTRQMLAFSRKQILSPVVLDLNAVINETAKMLKRLIGEDIEFELGLAESLWAIEADSDQIVQILMNLCVNARDAMPRGGTLTIATGNVTAEQGSISGQPYVPHGDYVRPVVSG